MQPLVLCLYFVALQSEAELVDHLSPRWRGASWSVNPLQIATLRHQEAAFPLVTQGEGTVTLSNEPVTIRLGLFIRTLTDEKIMTVWGTVTETKNRELATLYLQQGRLVWVCPVNPYGDSLFDAKETITMPLKTNPARWQLVDVTLDPRPYQQMFGWATGKSDPQNPAQRTRQGEITLARQPTSAEWHVTHLQIHKLNAIWLGRIELLDINASLPPSPNIIRQ